jgi:hypothetical protein
MPSATSTAQTAPPVVRRTLCVRTTPPAWPCSAIPVGSQLLISGRVVVPPRAARCHRNHRRQPPPSHTRGHSILRTVRQPIRPINNVGPPPRSCVRQGATVMPGPEASGPLAGPERHNGGDQLINRGGTSLRCSRGTTHPAPLTFLMWCQLSQHLLSISPCAFRGGCPNRSRVGDVTAAWFARKRRQEAFSPE